MAIPGLIPQTNHCGDNSGDRALGEYWERGFCKLAARCGKIFTPHQIGRIGAASAHVYFGHWHSMTLPDVTIWSSPGEHHEVKHKNPTRSGHYGLEDYRLRALKWFADETGQSVFYTIHHWKVDRNDKINKATDWETAGLEVLWNAAQDGTALKMRYPSYVAGQRKEVPGWLWPTTLWQPLLSIWAA